ncbi:MAG TPA: TolC family protein [Terriglobales bacterium]
MRNFAWFVLLSSISAGAQTNVELQTPSRGLRGVVSSSVDALPQAPVPQLPPASTPAPGGKQTAATSSSASPPKALAIKDAEQLALANNPQITVSRLTALAAQQVTRETRSALWPTAAVDMTGVDSHPGSRITAGGLNNPIIYERAAVGANVTQLITDFGHTTNLISSANLAAQAENENAVATREQIILATDQAFYGALQAQSVTHVAEQTVAARQSVADQVQALFNSKLKSQLDLSFAQVNLSQAKLLLLDAQNNENAAMAALSAVLGYPTLQNVKLIEDTTPLTAPSANVGELISDAFARRPELLALHYQYESARKFQTAERDLLFPAIRAAGAVGDTPARNPALSNWYGAVGVNIDIPVFNGFLYTARAHEASLRAQAADERLRDLRDRISRDVRTSWLNASTAYNRLAVTQQLLDEAQLALDLAQTRYKLGLGSIVELSQAQLQQTQAQIGNAQAGYDYRLASAVLRYEIAAP